MKCPACFNVLTQMQAGPVTVDVCHRGCGGMWFDAFELPRVDDTAEWAGELLVGTQQDPAVQVDATRKRDCPRCAGVKLKRRFFSPRRRVEIDECPGCGGIWLDAGELEKIREEVEETRIVQQNQARKPQLTMSVIRYIYRARLAESDGSE